MTEIHQQLRRLGVTQKNGKPSHPQTQGKVERFQQTLCKWLAAQHPQPDAIDQVQALLDVFVELSNTRRPHRSLPHRATPATVYAARPKAAPGADRVADTHDRVRRDKVSKAGSITLRHQGTLYRIGVGRAYAGTGVFALVQDEDIRVIDAATGEILRELVLDASRIYQPTGRASGPSR